MSTITHTYRERGVKFQEIARHQGAGTGLDGKWLVLYRDLDKGIDSITSLPEWESQWRAIDPDDCPICLGAGHDHIKGNRDKPFGGCYGWGKYGTTEKHLPTAGKRLRWPPASSSASWMVSEGVPLMDVKEVLGHSTIKMTEKYAHLAPH